MISDKKSTSQELSIEEKMQILFDEKFDISLLSLSSADGFDIHTLSRNVDIEYDKVSAIASTLCSVSDASAKQIFQEDFNITTVEMNNGLLLFLKVKLQDSYNVLCLAANNKLSLGEARFYAQQLVKEIESI